MCLGCNRIITGESYNQESANQSKFLMDESSPLLKRAQDKGRTRRRYIDINAAKSRQTRVNHGILNVSPTCQSEFGGQANP